MIFEESLSARRAWIEIQCNTVIDGQSAVSLSARRAWIEMTYDGLIASANFCRSPQGERG